MEGRTTKGRASVNRNTKRRIFDIIQIGQDSDLPSRSFDLAVMVMILTNLAIALLETFESLSALFPLFQALETLTVVFFTVEYGLRVWTAEYLYPELPGMRAVGRYVISFPGLVDLLSFAPFYLPIFFPAGVVAFRMFRVIRILRLFRINAYYDALSVIGDVVQSKRDQLVSSIFIILVLMTASSLCMYSLEHEAQPEVFKNAFSGFWWAVSTLLTVGYGDIYPITAPGRIFGIFITFLGVGMVAIPTGILSAGFVEQYTRIKSSNPQESEVRFVRLAVGEHHPWLDCPVGRLPLPPGLVLAVIQRRGRVLRPRGRLTVQPGDVLLLAAADSIQDRGITLRELHLRQGHPWIGASIRELDISRQTHAVLLRRDGVLTVPEEESVLQCGDTVLLYTARRVPDGVTLRIN